MGVKKVILKRSQNPLERDLNSAKKAVSGVSLPLKYSKISKRSRLRFNPQLCHQKQVDLSLILIDQLLARD